MRVVQKNTMSTPNFESDLKLVRLASSTTQTEPSENCFNELSQALREALETIERSLQK